MAADVAAGTEYEPVAQQSFAKRGAAFIKAMFLSCFRSCSGTTCNRIPLATDRVGEQDTSLVQWSALRLEPDIFGVQDENRSWCVIANS